jgi:hypothetical protein
MRLPLFQQKLQNVDLNLEGFGQLYSVRRGRGWSGLSDPNGGPVTHRDNLSDGRLTVENGDRFPPPHSAQILAEPSLQFRDSDLLHHRIMTRSGHNRKNTPNLSRRPSIRTDAPSMRDCIGRRLAIDTTNSNAGKTARNE